MINTKYDKNKDEKSIDDAAYFRSLYWMEQHSEYIGDYFDVIPNTNGLYSYPLSGELLEKLSKMQTEARKENIALYKKAIKDPMSPFWYGLYQASSYFCGFLSTDSVMARDDGGNTIPSDPENYRVVIFDVHS